MAHSPRDEHDETDQDADAAEARRTILDRRARFVAAALAGLAASCGGETSGSTPQDLSLAATGGAGGTNTSGSGGQPQVCLSATGGQPQVCLTVVGGASGDGGTYGAGGYPQVCLSPPLGGAGGVWNVGGGPPVVPVVDSGVDAPPNPTDGAPSGGAAGTGGLTGSGGLPLPCLAPPQAPPAKGS